MDSAMETMIDYRLFAGLNPSTQDIIRQEAEHVKLNKPILQTIIEKEFGVPEGKLLAIWRKREVVNARMLYCAILYHTTPLTGTKVGKITGRDHSTIYYARNSVATYLALEKDYREKTIRVLNNYYQRLYPRADMHFIKERISLVLELLIKNKSKQGLKHGSSLNKAIPAAENEINKAMWTTHELKTHGLRASPRNGLSKDWLLLPLHPLDVPSDEEVVKSCTQVLTPRIASFLQGARWMRKEIIQRNTHEIGHNRP